MNCAQRHPYEKLTPGLLDHSYMAIVVGVIGDQLASMVMNALTQIISNYSNTHHSDPGTSLYKWW